MCKPDINLAVFRQVIPSGSWPCIPMLEDMGDDEFRRIVGLPENFALSDEGLQVDGLYLVKHKGGHVTVSIWTGLAFENIDDYDRTNLSDIEKIGPRIQVPENF
jgi:hypothetical protein